MDLSEYHDLYLQEAQGYIVVLRTTLQRLYQRPEDVQALSEAHRAAHSLKSISATMNYQEPRAVAAEMEAILYKAHHGTTPLTQQIIGLMANTCDKLDTIIAGLQTADWTPAPRAPIDDALMGAEEVAEEPKGNPDTDIEMWDLGAGPAPGAPKR